MGEGGSHAHEFDVAHCIDVLKEVRAKCDAAQKRMIAIHLSNAIELLEREARHSHQS